MNVYLPIVSVPYEGGMVAGVFSTREKAEQHLDSHRDGFFLAAYQVVEVELDKPDRIWV